MFQPALEAAMESARAEIDKLTAQDAAPTFENTILPMEKGAGELSRALAVYGIWASNLNGPEVQAVQREVAPKLAAFQDALYQDAARPDGRATAPRLGLSHRLRSGWRCPQ